MKVLSLKLKEEIFGEVEKIVHTIHKPRNAYINDALAFYNKIYQRKLLKKSLHTESKQAAESSMEVLKEFEEMGDDILE